MIPINYCPLCSGPIRQAVPEGDDRARHVCETCGTIHYQNPKVIAGCIPVHGNRVLLCKRAIEPRLGFWTLPAGFMELGETTEQGALRETDEEAGAHIELQGLYCMLNVVQAGQVHLFYRARLLDTSFNPGPETIEAKLFRQSEIPWADLAFRTVKLTLERYFAERESGQFSVHFADIN
jgi:ADP-ribose pyrophosphatase YjhB (NUDIX family)